MVPMTSWPLLVLTRTYTYGSGATNLPPCAVPGRRPFVQQPRRQHIEQLVPDTGSARGIRGLASGGGPPSPILRLAHTTGSDIDELAGKEPDDGRHDEARDHESPGVALVGGQRGAGASVVVQVAAAELPTDHCDHRADGDDLGDGGNALALFGHGTPEAVAAEVQEPGHDDDEEDDRRFG